MIARRLARTVIMGRKIIKDEVVALSSRVVHRDWFDDSNINNSN